MSPSLPGLTPPSPSPSPQEIARIEGSQLFDAAWYLARHPDVALSGLAPAEHYARFGGLLRRDPGPVFSGGFFADTLPAARAGRTNPLIAHLSSGGGAEDGPQRGRVLWAAGLEALAGHPERAIALARRYLPGEHAPAVHLLEANRAVGRGSAAAWLHAVNAYLDAAATAPLALAPGEGALFDRLGTEALASIESGPVVSVIMPAWNAEATVGYAMRSILAQTWRPLQLIVVDDASTDATWARIGEIAATDDRVVCLRNASNAGPYVSKNIALGYATGTFITGHDADDWAHPQRLEQQVDHLMSQAQPAALIGMLRMSGGGTFTRFSPVGLNTQDGACVAAFISLMCDRDFFRTRLGHWDELRFGADSELIHRLRSVIGREVPRAHRVGMVCLDNPEGLTNHPEFGHLADGGLSPDRQMYKDAFLAWHAGLAPDTAYLDFPQSGRRFPAPQNALNPEGVVASVFDAQKDDPRRRASGTEREDGTGIVTGVRNHS